MRASPARYWLSAALAWPIAVYVAASAWPGSDSQPELRNYFSSSTKSASPPVDMGTDAPPEGQLSVTGADGAAKVFWSSPTPGQVHVHVEVPPNK